MEEVIRVESLTKDFVSGFLVKKIRALDNLNLTINQGETFGFLGPNGAGKTTTIKLLLGLIKPTKGRAWVFGKLVNDVLIKRRIGFLPESPYFYEYLTAWEFLIFIGQLSGMKDALKERVYNILKLVRLSEARDVQLKNFSRGMLQRIGIAQALVHNPDLTILDEPMGGLDPIGRKEVRDVIITLKEQGKTIFFSSHILPDVELICDRVGILIRGKLQSVGPLDQILSEEIESVEITAQNVPQSLLDKIKTLPTKVAFDRDRVLITIFDQSYTDDVIERLRANNVKLLSLIPRRKSLEDHFIAQIKKS